MTKVYKYEFERALNEYGTLKLKLPAFAKILSVQDQNGTACMWMMVNTAHDQIQIRTFHFIGTGQDVDPEWNYITTFQQAAFVWHLFEAP